MKSIKLSGFGNHSLLALVRDDNTVSQFCIAYRYNADAKYGDQWDAGHYFNTIEVAMEYWNEEIIGKKLKESED